MRGLLSQCVYRANRRSAFWTMYGRPIEESDANEDEIDKAEEKVDVEPTSERNQDEPGGDQAEDR